MKIDIPKFLLYVMMTSATTVAADSSSTLAIKVTVEEEKSLLNNEERATTTSTSSSFSSSLLVDSNAVVVDRTLENNGSSLSSLSSLSLVDANAVVVDRTSVKNDDSAVNRGDGSSSKTGTMHNTETFPADSDGGFSPPHGIINQHVVVDAINHVDEISSFTGTDSGDVFAQRKLIKSSKKVKHPEALCTLSLFAHSLFMYANKCFTDIMVTISPCVDKDDTCYISERLPSLPQEEQENQEEEQCFVGGSFPAKQNIRYNPSTGDCEFLYVDLVDDPCNLYTGDTGTGSLGLKARINVQNNPDVLFIQFTKDKGLTFYNAGDERFAVRSRTHNDDRYLRQEGATKPLLSMMPYPFVSSRRRLNSNVSSITNGTPHKVNFIRVEYCNCTPDENNFIVSKGTWTTGTDRGSCLVQAIHSSLILPDGSVLKCRDASTVSDEADFYVMMVKVGNFGYCYVGKRNPKYY